MAEPNNTLPKPVDNPNPQNAQISPKPEKTNKKLLAIILTIAIVIVALAVVLIVILTRPQTAPAGGDEPKPEEQKSDEVVGYDPGHPLPDDDKLDNDRTAEYTDALKVYAKLGETISYEELEKAVKDVAPKCTVTQTYDLGTISCGDNDRVRFNIEEKDGAKTTSYFNYSSTIGEENALFIRDVGGGKYEFGNDALLGEYSNKQRAINAYLYYIDLHKEFTKNQ